MKFLDLDTAVGELGARPTVNVSVLSVGMLDLAFGLNDSLEAHGHLGQNLLKELARQLLFHAQAPAYIASAARQPRRLP